MDEFKLEISDAIAIGFPVGRTDGGKQIRFLVRAGSTALVRSEAADRDGKLKTKIEKLKNDGILVPHPKRDDLLVFVQDFLFPSPTAAGDVVNGANLSAPSQWKHTETGISLKDWLSLP